MSSHSFYLYGNPAEITKCMKLRAIIEIHGLMPPSPPLVTLGLNTRFTKQHPDDASPYLCDLLDFCEENDIDHNSEFSTEH